MIIVVQDLKTGGGERIIGNFLSQTTRPIQLYSSEPCRSINVESIINNNWNTLTLIWLALKILFTTSKEIPIIVVLTKPIIIFGLLNILFQRKLFLYEHCDPYLLYFNRLGIFSKFKSALLVISLKSNNVIVVTQIIKQKLTKRLGLNAKNIHILQNPSTKITDHLVNIDLSHPSAKSVYVIIGRNGPEKRFDEAILYYHLNIRNSTTELWVVSNTSLDFEAVDHTFNSFDALNDYVSSHNIFYKPTLINFSVLESFSLVIAEFLAAGLPVLSSYSPTLDRLWSSYQGFELIGSEKPNEILLSRYKPFTYSDFESHLCRIVE